MHADVQKYFDTIDANDKARTEARRKRDEAYSAARAAYDAAYGDINDDDAWEELQKSSDPLIAWIAKIPMRRYPDYAKAILKMLPATREELDTYAITQGWCEEWDQFMDRAERAGVLPPAKNQATEQARELYRYATDNWGGNTGRKMRAMIAAAVAAELEAAKTATAEPDAK